MERGSVIDAQIEFDIQIRTEYNLLKSKITIMGLMSYTPYTDHFMKFSDKEIQVKQSRKFIILESS